MGKVTKNKTEILLKHIEDKINKVQMDYHTAKMTKNTPIGAPKLCKPSTICLNFYQAIVKLTKFVLQNWYMAQSH